MDVKDRPLGEFQKVFICIFPIAVMLLLRRKHLECLRGDRGRCNLWAMA
jgi:hypothetical protein